MGAARCFAQSLPLLPPIRAPSLPRSSFAPPSCASGTASLLLALRPSAPLTKTRQVLPRAFVLIAYPRTAPGWAERVYLLTLLFARVNMYRQIPLTVV